MSIKINQTTFTTDDGVSLPLTIVGNGPPLIILHGWTSSPESWSSVLEKLAKHFTCHIWNARAHVTNKNLTIERLAQDVRHFIEQFNLPKPTLMGHSMGALTCWEYIKQFGCEGFEKLVLIDQSPKILVDDGWQLGLFGNHTAQHNQTFIDNTSEDFVGSTINLVCNAKDCSAEELQALKESAPIQTRLESLKKLNPQNWVECWKSFSVKDYRSVLPSIAVPTLLFYGAESKYYGLAVADYVAKHIPGSQLVVCEHSGHSPPFEEYELFEKHLKQFLNIV